MPVRYILYFFILPFCVFSQTKKIPNREDNSRYQQGTDTIKKEKIATIDMYRFITLDRDTTYIDTSLTIQKEYSHNYLRKDNFGLLPFPNEGQTYNTLQYSLTSFSPLPDFGFTAKKFGTLDANQIKYCSVATPVTELYFKSVLQQGQSTDAFFSLNTSPRLNFSVDYKGLRSTGKYINQLASTGNFRFTTSYNTKNKRYFVKAHFASYDILNHENGGITTIEDFENGNIDFKNRQRLDVYLKDAKSFLKGKRIFVDHTFMMNAKKGANNLYVAHQFNYENKFFEYNQKTLSNIIVANVNTTRYGDSYQTGNINDQTHYNKMYNKAGLVYENTMLGKFQFFAEDFRTNYYYYKTLVLIKGVIPSAMTQKINNIGGQYEYRKNKWNGIFLYARSLSDQNLSNLDVKLKYDYNDEIQLSFQYQNINKLPNNNYNLYQSSYKNYNWSNDFKNEKINNLIVNTTTPWVNASVQFTTLNDHLYFNDISTNDTIQLANPNQYGKTINYLSIKANKEIKFGKFALDNTILYQKVDQSDRILNVPQIVTRNTVYYSNDLFKKAMYFQTGIEFDYFAKYYANDYNPVIGEFFVQQKKQIGNFPNLNFFFNARIQRTRIYLKAEHFNSSFSGNNFYAAPNTPYRDFTIRFGLVWNFFQ